MRISLSSMNSRSCRRSGRASTACWSPTSASTSSTTCSLAVAAMTAANFCSSSGWSAGTTVRPQIDSIDLVALVHRLLDQRVAAQRAHHVQAGHDWTRRSATAGAAPLRPCCRSGPRNSRPACAAGWPPGARSPGGTRPPPRPPGVFSTPSAKGRPIPCAPAASTGRPPTPSSCGCGPRPARRPGFQVHMVDAGAVTHASRLSRCGLDGR
jgi:hypothetical protein